MVKTTKIKKIQKTVLTNCHRNMSTLYFPATIICFFSLVFLIFCVFCFCLGRDLFFQKNNNDPAPIITYVTCRRTMTPPLLLRHLSTMTPPLLLRHLSTMIPPLLLRHLSTMTPLLLLLHLSKRDANVISILYPCVK